MSFCIEFLYSFLFLIISWVISEGSCDTEDWSMPAENSALPLQEK